MAKKSNHTYKKKNNKNPKLVFFLIGGVFILAMVLLFFLEKTPTTKDAIEIDTTGQPSLGKEDAPVTLVEFGDYKCIYCKQFDETIFPKIKKDYIDTGKVQFYFINKAFIALDSRYAAVVGDGVFEQNPEAFWDYHHAVYENQGPEDQEWATMETLLTIVGDNAPDVDQEELAKYVSSANLNDLLAKDDQIAANAKVTSTPTLFINGVAVEDSFNYEKIQEMIDQALENANE